MGQTVSDLQASAAFFTDGLGQGPIGDKPDYPAAFVSDGTSRITLRQVADGGLFVPFDRQHDRGCIAGR